MTWHFNLTCRAAVYFRRMRKISLWLFILTFTICAARAQDAATQQQIDKLSGQIQDMLEAQAAQTKRIDALEKEIGDLRDKLNQPAAANDSASADDLKKLAAQVQEIDRKRQADNEQILKTIEKLGKVSGGSAGTQIVAGGRTDDFDGQRDANAAGPQKGYDYTIAAGDTVSAIAKAYRAQGVKVTIGADSGGESGIECEQPDRREKDFHSRPEREVIFRRATVFHLEVNQQHAGGGDEAVEAEKFPASALCDTSQAVTAICTQRSSPGDKAEDHADDPAQTDAATESCRRAARAP